jgi:hypothetical protein
MVFKIACINLRLYHVQFAGYFIALLRYGFLYITIYTVSFVVLDDVCSAVGLKHFKESWLCTPNIHTVSVPPTKENMHKVWSCV